jgi:hypothetical protein
VPSPSLNPNLLNNEYVIVFVSALCVFSDMFEVRYNMQLYHKFVFDFASAFAFNVRSPANITSQKNKLLPCHYP